MAVGERDDSHVAIPLTMVPNVVDTVAGHHDPVVPKGELQHRLVGDASIRVSGLTRTQRIVAETSKLLYDVESHVLVGVEPRDPSASSWRRRSPSIRSAFVA